MTESKDQFTLENYLDFLGWEGPVPTASYDALTRLQRLHSTKIPFDNFDMHFENPVLSTNPVDVWPKVRDGRRGTYCFEGNFLFAEALQKIGFQTALIPVCSWRPFALSFAPLPSHCNVVIILDDKWYLLDVATVDMIDGFLDFQVDTIQQVANGMRYRLSIIPDEPFVIPDAAESRVRAINDKSVLLSNARDCVSFVVEKEDVLRDSDYNPIEPMKLEWVRRFWFRIPRSGIPLPELIRNDHLFPLLSFPSQLEYAMAELLVEFTALKDERAHHYKQWVGIRYTSEEKIMVAGFRVMRIKRPYGPRDIVRYDAPPSSDASESEQSSISPEERATLMQERWANIREQLESLVGIRLSEDVIRDRLRIRHNFTPTCGKTNEHVWPY